jgi:cytochrome c oxidase assembly protein subunit 15
MAGIVLGILGFGGYVRLNKAGLSMVKWDLIRLQAPTTNEEWQMEFDFYKNHPQYTNDFPNMSMEEFKWIYKLEHWHRQLGKSLSLVFLIPFLFFIKKGIIRKRLILSSLGIFSIGGVQATIGWWMVKSGLKENLGDQYEKKDVKVSPYRLAVHFSCALLIFCLLFKKGMFLVTKPQIFKNSILYAPSSNNIRKNIILSLHALWLTIAYGSFMAGMDAGKIINTFPKMGDVWFPTKHHFDPKLITDKFNYNFTENPFVVHFTHRTIATATLLSMIGNY